MPIEVSSFEEFLEYAKRAVECRVKRSDDVVKIKARTPSRLVTYKASPEKLDEILTKLREIGCSIVEI